MSDTSQPPPVNDASAAPLGRLTCAWALAWILVWPAAALADSACGVIAQGQGSGPFDYRSGHPRIKVAEDYHFTPKVEALLQGQSTTNIAGDLEFVLRYVPNHHRVLVAMVTLAERQNLPQARGAMISVTCHFTRAIQFAPDDLVVRMMFANYLFKSGRGDAAEQQLGYVQREGADDPFTQYNIGMVYMQAGQFDKALVQAHRASKLGFPRTELREQLAAQGHWHEPVDDQ